MNNNFQSNKRQECEKHLSSFGRKVFDVLKQYHRTGEFTSGKNQINKRSVDQYAGSCQRCYEGIDAESGSNFNLPYNKNNDFVNPENLTNLSDDLNKVLSGVETQTTQKTAEVVKRAQVKNSLNTHLNIEDTTDSDKMTNSQPIFGLPNTQNEKYFTAHLSENVDTLNMDEQLTARDLLDNLHNFDMCDNIENIQILCEKKKPKNDKRDFVVKSHEIKRKEKNKNDLHNSSTVNLLRKQEKILLKVTDKKAKTKILKRKYTKSVKSWLNSVDPTNSVDGIDFPIDSRDTNSETNITLEYPDILQISLENIEVKSKPKTMVQAQLINENGLMKFRKPRSNSELRKTLYKQNSQLVEASKIKVNKYKFVPPLKSQNSCE